MNDKEKISKINKKRYNQTIKKHSKKGKSKNYRLIECPKCNHGQMTRSRRFFICCSSCGNQSYKLKWIVIEKYKRIIEKKPSVWNIPFVEIFGFLTKLPELVNLRSRLNSWMNISPPRRTIKK